jgi:hypothetical protein
MTELPPQMPDQRPPPTAKDAGCGCLVGLVIIGIAASVILVFGVLPERKAAREMEARTAAMEARRAAMTPAELDAEYEAKQRELRSIERDRRGAQIEAANVIICAETGDCGAGMSRREARAEVCAVTGDFC